MGSKTHTIVFDTETTGLPVTNYGDYYHPSHTNYYDSSRLVELGWITYMDGEEVSRHQWIVSPDGFKVTATQIHGITHEYAVEHGSDIDEVLDEFATAILPTNTVIVAHNIKFDINVILAECYRKEKYELIQSLMSKKQYCTAQMGELYLHAKGIKLYNTSRKPKLIHLFKQLFGEEFTQEHRAISDVIACARCFHHLEKLSYT